MKEKKIQIDIKQINDPNIVKSIPYKQLGNFSDEIRRYIIQSVSKNGGHLASNLGTVDATISLCRCFDFSKDKILFDVGHQSYTYKILTGRSLDNLRQKNGISGFQKIKESTYDVFEAGHSSTSISAANGMAIARDLKDEDYNIIAFIGDASIVSGLAFEGLNNVSQGNHKIIIILNDNNMSISRPIGGMGRFLKRISHSAVYTSAKEKYKRILLKTRIGNKIYNASFRFKNRIKHFLVPVTIFDNMGFKYIGPVSGHDFKAMDKAFLKAKKQKKSVVVHLRTIKGKGYKYSENDKIGDWHGVKPFDIKTGLSIEQDKTASWSKIYADIVHDAMSKNQNLVVINPAMVNGSSLQNIFKDFKKRCFDVGISEEHAFTMASGVSLNGLHPIISIYSTFLQRGYDEMLHDVIRMNLNCTVLIDRSGLCGNDGDTHLGIFDESLIYNLPGNVITMASNPKQAKILFIESISSNHGLFAIRYPKENIFIYDNDKIANFAEWNKILDYTGAKKCVVGVGPNTIRLCKLISDSNKNVDVYEAVYQKPYNFVYINELKKYSEIIIYQSYATKHGFVDDLTIKLYQSNYKGKLVLKYVPDQFINEASIQEQLKDLKLLPEDIFELL